MIRPIKIMQNALNARALFLLAAVMVAFATSLPTKALAQGMAEVASGLRTNPDAPIEIEANQLDILDQKKVAIFKGNVVAKQGETVLRTGTLTIHYSGGGAGTAQSITRLEANGGVTITQKDQRATGSRAFVDMKKEQITLSGKVVLTQGQNVLRGSKLFIDMRSGAARLAATQTQKTGAKSGRVQGLFIPNRRQKN